MVGLGLRQLRCVFDPWNLVAGIPVGLTMCVIAYAGLAWTESLGEAKPVNNSGRAGSFVDSSSTNRSPGAFPF